MTHGLVDAEQVLEHLNENMPKRPLPSAERAYFTEARKARHEGYSAPNLHNGHKTQLDLDYEFIRRMSIQDLLG
jgi:hypothetical protein